MVNQATNRPEKSIPPDEIPKALQRSGYLLEARISAILQDFKLRSDPNTMYVDLGTGKTREMDIYSYQPWLMQDANSDLQLSLLIECIKTPQPIVFMAKDPQIHFLRDHDIKWAGIPTKVKSKTSCNGWETLTSYLNMKEYHHFCSDKLATQYCSFQLKKQEKEWMSFHDEDSFNVFQSFVGASQYLRTALFSEALGSLMKHETIELEQFTPVLVIEGEILELPPSGDLGGLKPVQHIQYRRASFIGMRDANLQVDVVNEKHFPTYLKMILEEWERTKELVGTNLKHLNDSAKQLKTILEKAKVTNTEMAWNQLKTMGLI